MRYERHPRKSKMTQRAKRTENEDVLFIRGVPPEVKHKFKAYCGLRGKSMTRTVIQLLKDTINKEPRLRDGAIPPPKD